MSIITEYRLVVKLAHILYFFFSLFSLFFYTHELHALNIYRVLFKVIIIIIKRK